MRSELWLVRHGETEWSASGRHTSTTDVDLTIAGVEAAKALGEALAGLSFTAVWTSPRLRTRRTAELAGFPDADLVDDLQEWEYGADEGRTTAEIRVDRPRWTVWTDGPSGGETPAEVGERADRLLARVRTAGSTHDGRIPLDPAAGTGPLGPAAGTPDTTGSAAETRVLAFCHGHFSRVVGARWLGLPVAAGAHLRLSTASVSVLGWERETPAIVHWNHTGSLL